MNLIGEWLIRTSTEGSILIAVALGLSWLLGRHLAPRWRVTLWALVGCKLLVPAFLPASPGLGNWLRPQPSVETSSVIPVSLEERVESNEPVPVLAPVVHDPRPVSTFIGAFSPTPVADSAPVYSAGRLLIFLWLVGVVGFVAIVFFRQRRFALRSGLTPCRDSRLLTMVRNVAREHGVRGEVRVMLAPKGSTPAAYGAWWSCLLLPRDWEERFDLEALTYIVRHEIEHIRYRDVFLNWVAAAVNALHWFNPLVWIAVSRFQSDRELRCDADILSRLNPVERIDYGRTLLRVQSEFLPAPAIAGVAPCVRNHPALHQRIIMITNPTERKSWLNAILGFGFAVLILVSFGAAIAEEERPLREGDHREGDKPVAREGDKPRPEVREGDRREGDHHEADRHEADRHDGGRREGDRREGDRREGDRHEGDRREGDRPGQEGNRPVMHEGDLRIVVLRDGVIIGDRRVSFENLREELGHSRVRGAVIFAQPDLPFHQVNNVVMALRGSGIHDVRIGGLEGARNMPGEGGRPMPQGGPRDGDKPRPEGVPHDGDKPRPEGVPRDGDKPRPEGPFFRDGDKPRPEGAPRDGDKPRPEGAFRDGDRPRPEGAPRDGDKPRPEGAPRDGVEKEAEGV